jgi:glycosyltransferase involved in cell wall biosynthesis
MKLSIILPAHNEEERIRPTLDAYIDYFNGIYGDKVEYIVIVNGSIDNTVRVVHEYIAQYKNVKMVDIKDRIGKGGALLRGFHEAIGDLVGFVDADGATPPQAFQDLVDHIGDAGCIIASRWLPESNVVFKQPLPRRIVSRIFNRLVKLLFGVDIHDTQCGAKLLTREAVDRAVFKVSSHFWAFDVDLLFQVAREGFKVTEHPTTWHDIAGSKVKVVKSSWEMLLAIFRLRLRYSPLRPLVNLADKLVGRHIFQHRIMQGRLIMQQQRENDRTQRLSQLPPDPPE